MYNKLYFLQILKYANDQQSTFCQQLKKTFPHDDSPTCECDVVDNG